MITETQTQSLFKNFFKNSSLPSYSWVRVNTEFVLSDYNESGMEITNGGVKGFVGKTLSEMYAGQSEVITDFMECIKKRKTIKRNMRYIFQSTGKDKYLDVYYVYINDNLVVVQTEDITRNKEIEIQLTQKEKILESLFQSDQLAIVIVSFEKFNYLNPRVSQLTEYSSEELKRMNFIEIIHPQYRDKVINELHNMLYGKETGNRYDFPFLTKRGEVRWVDGAFSKVEYNGENVVLGTMFDITQNKQSELELINTKENLKKILEGTSDGFITIDGNWNFFYLNKKASDFLNRNVNDLVGKNIWNEFPELVETKFYQAAINVMKKKITVTIDDYFEPLDKWFLLKVYPVKEGISFLYHDLSDLRENEIALRKSENYLKTVFNNTMLSILVADDQGNYLDANKSASQLLGISVNEIKEMNVADLGIKGYDSIEQRYRKFVQAGDEVGEFHFINFKGEEKIALYQANRIEKDFNVSMLVDVTSIRKSERELAAIEERNRTLVEAIPDLMFRIREDGTFLDYKADHGSQLKLPPDKFVGKKILDIFPKNEGIIHFNQLKKALESDKPVSYEYEMNTIQGGNRHFEARVVRSRNEKEVIFIARDITDKKRAELMLMEAESTANVGSWEWDVEKDTCKWSEETFRIFGLPPVENMPFAELISMFYEEDKELVKKTFLESTLKGEPYSIEYRIARPDGEVRFINLRAKPLIKNGRTVRLLGSIQDITKQKRSEEKLMRSYSKLEEMSNKLEWVRENEKKQIAMWLHDELGQKLSVIKLHTYGIIEVLKSDSHSDADRNLIGKLYNIVNMMSDSIESVRNISHDLSPLVLDKLGMIPALEILMETFSQNYKIRIANNFSIDELSFDKEFSINIYRILQESLNNVSKHANASEVKVNLVLKDKSLIFEIIDNGKGIESGLLGKGMGHTNINERIKQWGGKMDISPGVHSGTCLKITFPVPIKKVYQ